MLLAIDYYVVRIGALLGIIKSIGERSVVLATCATQDECESLLKFAKAMDKIPYRDGNV